MRSCEADVENEAVAEVRYGELECGESRQRGPRGLRGDVMNKRLSVGSMCAILVAVAAGCGRSPAPQYRLNYIALTAASESLELTPQQEAEYAGQIQTVLTALFGTPNEPYAPPGSGLDERKLLMAAGPTGGDPETGTLGLFREHCIHCHGITGDGKGPTAPYLNPYPRDYRPAVFKAKGTALSAHARREDLHHILMQGIPGTSMPSFRLLAENEVEALVEYVKYLSYRGEVEQALINYILFDLEEGEAIPTDANTLASFVDEVNSAWAAAYDNVVEPPSLPEEDLAASIRRGRELFLSDGGCVKCHGELALGDGQQNDYDMWNKAVFELSQTDPAAAAEYGLPVRNIKPRNLRQGIYRFGRRPLDLYRRLHEGIAGTPMPGIGSTPGITKEDIWHIVNYVRSLPYESLSQSRQATSGLERERL